ncbi:hypothetical protein STEG23_012479, partial [Scotinomys teguina]
MAVGGKGEEADWICQYSLVACLLHSGRETYCLVGEERQVATWLLGSERTTAKEDGGKSDQQLDCALDLMRRLPPQQIEKNLSDLIDLVPSLCEDLLSSVDQPLKIARDKVVGKDYLLCDYNRDGDSYRSPWSNKYDPPLEDGAMPSARLRKLEVEANNAFDQYRDLKGIDDLQDVEG